MGAARRSTGRRRRLQVCSAVAVQRRGRGLVASAGKMSLDRSEPLGEESALHVVVGKGQGLLICLGRFPPSPELAQEISAGGTEVAGGSQGRIREQRRKRGEASDRAVTQADRDRAIELAHG